MRKEWHTLRPHFVNQKAVNIIENDTILKISNLTKTFPGVLALDNVSMEIKRGEVHALIGENGAGKSTMIRTITGAIKPDSGTITFEGTDYSSLNPALSQEIGIAAIYQEILLAPPLTIMENIYMGQKINDGILVDKKKLYDLTAEVLKKLNTKLDPKELVRNLSVAYQQIVEIAKAIAKNAKFLIMDEPTAPLTEEEVKVLFQMVKSLNEQGITILYISHRLEELFEIADRVTIMRDGKFVATEEMKDVDKAKLIYHMVGRKLNETFPQRKIKYGETALEVKNLIGQYNKETSFSVKYGEILGLGGLVGAGRTELVRMIFGADEIESGEVFVDGAKVHITSPKDAVSLGIGFIPEDRKNQGVVLNFPIDKNLTLPIIKQISKALGIVDKKQEKEIVDKQEKDLAIKTPSMDQLVKNLSGGNQQKVVVGKWLASKSKILILDEPTRGIDVGAKQEIYRLINELAEQGKAIIVISSEMEEMLGLTDRMLVLYEGKYMAELKKEEYTQEKILQYASGEENVF